MVVGSAVSAMIGSSTALTSQRARGLKAVHVRHAQVHQDDIKCRRGRNRDGLAAVVCRLHGRARSLQQLRSGKVQIAVIFSQQDVQARDASVEDRQPSAVRGLGRCRRRRKRSQDQAKGCSLTWRAVQQDE